jgi:hypothetical protein
VEAEAAAAAAAVAVAVAVAVAAVQQRTRLCWQTPLSLLPCAFKSPKLTLHERAMLK